MTPGHLDFDRVAREMRNSVGKSGLLDVALRGVDGLGKIENRRLKSCGLAAQNAML